MFSEAAQPASIFLLQVLIIVGSAQVCGYLFKRIGQPAVMGEIIAGIILGPSLVGRISPSFSAFIFPPSSLGNLQFLSQVGLILFMFVIGIELDLTIVKKKARSAILVSISSIIIPLALGIALSIFLHDEYAPDGVPFYVFALFIGTAMSITAFPVLARIIRERNITDTNAGSIALISAAIGDVAGWCILAFVVAIAKAGSLETSLLTVSATVVYILVMYFVVRPVMKRILLNNTADTIIDRRGVVATFIMLLVSAYVTESIGIHSLFGAFMAGIIMPVNWNIREIIINKIEDVALILLLPVFFILTGLRTQAGLLNDLNLWMTCALVILVAVAGKFGASIIAARISGINMHDSLSISALMNTRGLMELIILNIGYDLGILSPQIFTMMVVMALVTTFMTSPLLNLFDRMYHKSGA